MHWKPIRLSSMPPLLEAEDLPVTLDDADKAAVARRIVRGAAALAVAAAVVQAVVHLANLALFDLSVNLLNVDSDTSAFGWASVVTEGSTAAIVVLIAASMPRRRGRVLFLSGLLAFLSLDDAVEIHERLSAEAGRFLDFPHSSRLFWPMVYFPLLAATFMLLWSLVRHALPQAQRVVRLGLLLLVAAVALEAASPLVMVGWDHGDVPYELQAVVEEGLELGGWVLIAAGVGTILTCGARRSVLADTSDAGPPTLDEGNQLGQRLDDGVGLHVVAGDHGVGPKHTAHTE